MFEYRRTPTLPKEGTIRRTSKHNSIQFNESERPIQSKIIGPTSMTEEIWIDGIEHLENPSVVNSCGNNSGKKDSSATFNTSLPFIVENNSTIKPQSTNLLNLLCSDVNQNYASGKIIETIRVFTDMISLRIFLYISATYQVHKK